MRLSQFSEKLSVHPARDIGSRPWRATLNREASASYELGYDLWQIDYIERKRVVASRRIAAIHPAGRIGLAFRLPAAPRQILRRHRGKVDFITAMNDGEGILIDPVICSGSIKLEPGTFYTLYNSSQKLTVVSGLYPAECNFEEAEVGFQPTDPSVITPAGKVSVPDCFRLYFAAAA